MRRKRCILPWVGLLVSIVLSVCCVIVKLTTEQPVVVNAEQPVDRPRDKPFIEDVPLSSDLQEMLYEASNEFGVDYYIMLALIERETQFANVMGDDGESYGYCQVQPKWWYSLMVDIDATNLNEPQDNFRAACAILARLIYCYGTVQGGLVAYNQGYYSGVPTEYSRYVMSRADVFRQ